jgi:hypothetical protein
MNVYSSPASQFSFTDVSFYRGFDSPSLRQRHRLGLGHLCDHLSPAGLVLHPVGRFQAILPQSVGPIGADGLPQRIRRGRGGDLRRASAKELRRARVEVRIQTDRSVYSLR